MDSVISLTPEVEVGSFILYLIRIDEEVVGYISSKDRAKAIVDSFAAYESKKMTNKWTKVMREDKNNGNVVILRSQSLGRIYNSGIHQSMKIDFIAAPCLSITKGRYNIEVPFDLPQIPDCEITKKRSEVTATPQNDSTESDSSDESSDSEYFDEEEDY